MAIELKQNSVFYYENRKCYIVTHLENEKNPQIVYKFYGKYKQWWHYEIIDSDSFKWYEEREMITKKRMK